VALAEAARFWTPAEGHIVQGLLESAGIDCVLFDAGMNTIELTGLIAPVRLMVDEDDLAAAQRVIGSPDRV
jgi:hypothetical protein